MNCNRTGRVRGLQIPTCRHNGCSTRHRASVVAGPRGHLETLEIESEDGLRIPFQIDPFRRHCLMNGLDDIGLTLEQEGAIVRYEAERAVAPSWVGSETP